MVPGPRPPMRSAPVHARLQGAGRGPGAPRASASSATFVGLDFGTSGARVTVIDAREAVLHTERVDYGCGGMAGSIGTRNAGERDAGGGSAASDPAAWRGAMHAALDSVPSALKASCVAIAVDGTSSTCMLVDRRTWKVQSRALMYDFVAASPRVTEAITQAGAPPGHIARSATSTLAKLLTLLIEDGFDAHDVTAAPSGVDVRDRRDNRGDGNAGGAPPPDISDATEKFLLVHQADWLQGLLLAGDARASSVASRGGVTDWNNALKLGFDPAPEACGYPDWLLRQPYARILPRTVVPPCTPLGRADPALGLAADAVVCAGTTDSIAAFVAAASAEDLAPGDAVTSLGTTTALKLLSRDRVDDLARGVYSHRLWDGEGGVRWLAGGASNCGGGALRKVGFDDDHLAALSERIDAEATTGLSYYPLAGGPGARGERFPVNDPDLRAVLEPRPEDDALFLVSFPIGPRKILGIAQRID